MSELCVMDFVKRMWGHGVPNLAAVAVSGAIAGIELRIHLAVGSSW